MEGSGIRDGCELAAERDRSLRVLDETASVRFSHENKDVQRLYDEFMEKPLSHRAHMLLHTDHMAWEMPGTGRK